MTQQFYTVLTNAGAAALANASVLGQGISLTEFAVGDGGSDTFNPDAQTMKGFSALTNELYRGAINELIVDPENSARYYAEGVVPLAVGGWTVREAGWFLDDGTLFAVTKYPPSYKSIPADGVATELPVRTYIATGSTDTVELKIDPTVVLATRAYVSNSISALTKADVGLSNVPNYGATSLYDAAATDKFATQKSVHDAHQELKSRVDDLEIYALAGI